MDSDRVKGEPKEGEGKLAGDDKRAADGASQEGWGKTTDKARDAKDSTKDKLDDAKDKIT